MISRRGFLLELLAAAAPIRRPYHRVPIAKLATTRWTHVEVVGLVTYVRQQQDGDWHVTLEEGGAKAVLEIIPAIPLPVPKKGMRIVAWGIARFDRGHGFAEVHPVEGWAPSR